MRVGSICRVHGFYKGICKQCEEDYMKASRGRGKLASVNVNTDKWVSQGEYEHIDPMNPHMRFNSKSELKEACEKRGLLVKCLMKPKSASKGFEHSKR